MQIEGKRAIVTGGAMGIGRAISMRLAAEGCRVAVVDIDRERGEETKSSIESEYSQESIFLETDTTVRDEIRHMVETVLDKWGGVDILVNNAGIREIRAFTDIEFDEWKRVLEVNLDGPFLCSKEVVPSMIESGEGCIINVSSTSGVLGSIKRPAYTTSKHGLIGLTRAMAGDLSRYGIRVNALAPGITETPLTREYFEDEDVSETIRSMTPMGRWGRPEEMVGGVVFLCSDDASFITGSVLVIDGGFVAVKSKASMLGDRLI